MLISLNCTRTHTIILKKKNDNKSLNNKNDCSSDDDDCLINLLPVFLSGKSESYLAIEDGGWGILYGWELTDDAAPSGKDSPDELFNIPLWMNYGASVN